MGVVIINHFSFATNSEVFSLSVAIKRVKGKGSVLNVTVTSFETVEKLKIYVKISLDDNSQLNGNKELVNTVFDVQKVLNGIYSNRIGRAVVDSILQRVDFVPKFPIPPVSLHSDLTHAIIINDLHYMSPGNLQSDKLERR